MEDMDKDTVDFVPNYDERLHRADRLPRRISRTCWSMAAPASPSAWPPTCRRTIWAKSLTASARRLTTRTSRSRELMKHIKGPDFPDRLHDLRRGGHQASISKPAAAALKVRGKVGVEELKGGKRANHHHGDSVQRESRGARRAHRRTGQREESLTDITAVRDESDENTRVVIELKRDAIPKVIINNLYKHTALESGFAVNALAIDHGRPKTLGLKELINCYIEHRREVIMRRTRFELRKAEERAEMLEGYLIALANLDEFIRIIRSSANSRGSEDQVARVRLHPRAGREDRAF